MSSNQGRRILSVVVALSCVAGIGRAANAQLFVSNSNSGGGISEYSFTGTFIRTFVASGSGGLSSPNGMVFGPDGNLYTTSAGTGSIKKYDGTTGAYLGDVVTGLSTPYGLRFGADGLLYTANFGSNSVSKIDTSTGSILQNYTSGLNRPEDVYVLANGDMIVPSGTGSNPVKIDHTTGQSSTFATGAGVVVGTALGTDGRFYFSDYNNGGVTVVPATGGVATSFVSGGSLNHPQYLAFGNNSLYVGSIDNNTVQYFNSTTGAFQGSFNSARATGIAIRGTGSAAAPEPSSLVALLPSLALIAGCVRRRNR